MTDIIYNVWGKSFIMGPSLSVVSVHMVNKAKQSTHLIYLLSVPMVNNSLESFVIKKSNSPSLLWPGTRSCTRACRCSWWTWRWATWWCVSPPPPSHPSPGQCKCNNVRSSLKQIILCQQLIFPPLVSFSGRWVLGRLPCYILPACQVIEKFIRWYLENLS